MEFLLKASLAIITTEALSGVRVALFASNLNPSIHIPNTFSVIRLFPERQ